MGSLSVTDEERTALIKVLHSKAEKNCVNLHEPDIELAIEIFWALDAGWRRDSTASAQSIVKNLTLAYYATVDEAVLVEIVRDVWADIYTS